MPRASKIRSLAGGVIVLLFAMLPAMVAGARLDAPAAAGEWQRLEVAEGHGGATSEIARRFYALTAQDVPRATDRERLVAARRAQLLGLLALGGLTYLAVMLARGRAVACLACLGLALVGPVRGDGYRLRPETPAAVFLALTVLMLVLLTRLGGGRRGRSDVVQAYGAAIAAGFTAALSLCASNGTAAALLVPGLCMALTTVVLLVRVVQVLRRHMLLMPRAAATRRLAPWLVAALSSLLASALLLPIALDQGVEAVASLRGGPLFGEGVAGWVGLAAAALGTVAVGWRVGFALGRRSRLPAEGVLFVAALVGAALFGPFGPAPGPDGLVLAGAVGWLAAEGVWWPGWLAWVAIGVRVRGRRD